MNIPEYNTELINNIVSNLANIIPKNNNESLIPTYDYMSDNIDYNMNYSGESQHLETILQQLFSKMSDNQTITNIPSKIISPSTLSFVSSLPLSSNNENSFRLLSIISFWFVLIINPIVILFGVIGNLLAIYILLRFNILKLPVSFYTVMLNVADTLNLLIPVFIFWLDNCFNRTPERGYFRDKSNFLCKALMCPDQLFTALSAWYMCAISFNRWYSVCHPSSYFLRQNNRTSKSTIGSINNYSIENNLNSRKRSSGSLKSFCFPFDCCCCITNLKQYRQHIQAFRSIGIITLLGILCCLYPIFMHELRSVISTNQHVFDLTQKTTHTYAVIWKRCYYSQKHEYSYDIIGIILSCLLHILPLTFVAVMNLMIIIRLRQRQRLLSMSTNSVQSTSSHKKRKRLKNQLITSLHYKKENDSIKDSFQSIKTITETHKDQSTLTDSLNLKLNQSQTVIKLQNNTPRRHHARDRAITIMLVSVALSYLILTIPYRLFWSYNVYIKRMYPEKLNSSVYLLKMHYIDHILRTIRNIHYATNFIFFIFLSKIFRRKFQQLFMGKILYKSNSLFYKRTLKRKPSQEYPSKLEEPQNENYENQNNYSKQKSFNKTSRYINDTCIQNNRTLCIGEAKYDDELHIV